MGPWIESDHHETRSVFVQSMDDAGPRLAADFRRLRKQGSNRVCERPPFMTGCRVYHHSSRFVDHGQVAILEEDSERNRLRCGTHTGTDRNSPDYPISGRYSM